MGRLGLGTRGDRPPGVHHVGAGPRPARRPQPRRPAGAGARAARQRVRAGHPVRRRGPLVRGRRAVPRLLAGRPRPDDCSSPASGATRTSATGGSTSERTRSSARPGHVRAGSWPSPRALLGDWLRLYQVHSLTPDSPLLTDAPLLAALAELRAGGVEVGVSTSGPRPERGDRAGARAFRRRRQAGHLGAGDLEPAGALGRPGARRGPRRPAAGSWSRRGRQRPAGRRRGRRRPLRAVADRYGVGPDAVAMGAGWPSRGATSCCPAR